MGLRKSEIYNRLWQGCDALRGGMDSSLYKDYVLVLLFIKYVSDRYANEKFPQFTVPDGAGFADLVALKGRKNIGEEIDTKIIAPLQKANAGFLAGVPSFNDDDKLGQGKEMVDRLTSLIAIFEDRALDFSSNRADGDDILGDAYEFLMRHFATESGKSKGQFYTPAEVSRVMAHLSGIADAPAETPVTVYDPTCGSGSLLLKVRDQAREDTTVSVYGQEKDVATANLARMNMVLHGDATADIQQGNTLTTPRWTQGRALKTYDFVVANPPFSDKAWTNGMGETDKFGRFNDYGRPPTKQGDYAYLLHVLASLRPGRGRGVVVMPHGVLFRGHAEAAIREQLVRRGLIEAIVGLPPNLFYGTGIPACLIVLDKAGAEARGGVFITDASRGFVKDGAKNRLRERDAHRIVDVVTARADTDRYARFVPTEEIERHGFNLNIPRYVDARTREDTQDIEGHLKGGVPERDVADLSDYWRVSPSLEAALFAEARPGYRALRPERDALREAIAADEGIGAHRERLSGVFEEWAAAGTPGLEALAPGFAPKPVLAGLAEDLLARHRNLPLTDAYAAYQHLMDYADEVMRDDLYTLAAEGWVAKPERITSKDKNGRTKDRGWFCDLVPKPLVVARYLGEKQAALDTTSGKLATVEAELDALTEEHGGEDGALQDVKTATHAAVAWEAALADWLTGEDEDEGRVLREALADRDEAATAFGAHKRSEAIARVKARAGRLSEKAIRDRLDEAEGEEAAALAAYLDASDEQKRTRKAAADLVEEIDASALERLDAAGEAASDDEALAPLAAIRSFRTLLDDRTRLRAEAKAADEAIDEAAYAIYPKLDGDAVRTLVIGDKWMASLRVRLAGEARRPGARLSERVAVLADRYADPLPHLTAQADAAAAKVAGHLARMGLT